MIQLTAASAAATKLFEGGVEKELIVYKSGHGRRKWCAITAAAATAVRSGHYGDVTGAIYEKEWCDCCSKEVQSGKVEKQLNLVKDG